MKLEPPEQLQQALHDALGQTRQRTLLLLSGLDPDLAQVSAAECLSPPVWDLGHIANFQEQWLLKRLAGLDPLDATGNDTYDPFLHPRPQRRQLRLPDLEGAQAYLEEVLRRVLQRLPRLDLGDAAPRLVAHGFVHRMLALHEDQHQETMLQSFALHGDRYHIPKRAPPPEPAATTPGWCHVPTGTYRIGRSHEAGSYDNEAPAHEIQVESFEIARYPVTLGDYLMFVECGGYDDPDLWSPRGQAWLSEEPHHAPLNWSQDDSGTWLRRIPRDGLRPVTEVPDEILCHVTYFEAEAYARWRGARLPTEAEWEVACRGDGDGPPPGNVDQLTWGPSRIGAYDHASPCGARHMLGDVWEWCATGLEPYPGFEAFPYREYSEVFFGGDHRILRGGSWATRASIATATFRNWDHPYRRQIFSGIRLARHGGAHL